MAPVHEPTVGSVLAESVAALAAAGCPSPQADAEQLMMHVSGRSRTDLLLSRRDRLADDDPLVARLPALIARRVDREPLQHIVGTAPMGRLDLAVGPGVFVPRPETEFLAQWCVDALRSMKGNSLDDGDGREAGSPPLVVDLCTGSGALALGIADAVPAASVVGVEIDDVARGWAERNVSRCRELWSSEPAPRTGDVSVIAGDVTDMALVGGAGDSSDAPLAHLRGRVDLVVSNPPYVPLSTDVGPEVRHDPRHAVFGGDDGLDVMRPMMNVVRALLRPGGLVAIEHDDDSGGDVVKLLESHGCFDDIAVHPDLAGRDRFTTAVLRDRRHPTATDHQNHEGNDEAT
ncbi:peptide chain release factor N(5)-glutamine methyltransferase [uncultured Corynebacterium sp.]|uniref:peptide chain release factor N(5)-glutamine methyltransferase n=1 Tax=uncultured Corynebacterium sp. TaxID=159447 RepID=UPI0025F6EA6A|nr:peptide chain release factor N(5)-glutamine methyltransferase [uncultured Corynebacterium sp.]